MDVARPDSARTTEPPPASAPRTKKKKRRPKLASMPAAVPTAERTAAQPTSAGKLLIGAVDTLDDVCDAAATIESAMRDPHLNENVDKVVATFVRTVVIPLSQVRDDVNRVNIDTSLTLRAAAEAIFYENAPKSDPWNAAALLVIEIVDALELLGNDPALAEHLCGATDALVQLTRKQAHR